MSERPPIKSRFCLAVLLDAHDRILLLRRAAEDDFAPGRWGLPGGHIHGDETPEDTIRREVAEETGLDLKDGFHRLLRYVGPVRDTLYGGVFEIHLYLYAFGGPSDVVVLNEEHDAQAWVTRAEYADYAVVGGIDEDLRYLEVWPEDEADTH
jgi:8-oxo-dGTP diphosphatase